MTLHNASHQVGLNRYRITAFNFGMNLSKVRRTLISIVPGCVSYRGEGQILWLIACGSEPGVHQAPTISHKPEAISYKQSVSTLVQQSLKKNRFFLIFLTDFLKIATYKS